jgi:cob(I)alamin adenosyltransferase
MLMSCANPQCAKPLHYLREGRIYIFDSVKTNGGAASTRAHQMEHFWLCGDCSKTMILEQTAEGVRAAERRVVPARSIIEMPSRALAS